MLDFVDFAAALKATPHPQAALELFMTRLAALGFTTWDYGFGTSKVADPRTALDLDFEFMQSNVDWGNRYFEYGYVAVDRNTPRNLQGITPHLYSEVLWQPTELKLQQQMEDDIHAMGIFSGLSVPMYMPGGRFGILNLGSALDPAEFARQDAESRPLVAMLSHVFHEHMTAQWLPARPESLTARERECLHWAAQGKTAWEIGEILDISERTVKKHIASAMARLQAATRTQAVAKAAARGLIMP